MNKRILIFYIILVISGSAAILSAQAGEQQKQRVVRALRTDEPIKIDGLLKEKVWQGEGYSSFIQSEPQDGAPASEKTVVRVAYDNKAIYIAGNLYDSQPGKIIGRLGRRDDFVESDWFSFSIDPYYDRRSGFEFAVNPSGSIMDFTIFNDENKDATWDGVWEGKARIHDKGWSVEFRIPFDQLRFKQKKDYVWGIYFNRIIKRKNERSGFTWIAKEESGFVSHFARLEGIENIRPGHRIEMLPFLSGKGVFSPGQEGNPFETGEDFTANAGMDLKVGLKSNLTLNLTANPDFGQVEVDPAVINLSAAETFYAEKRPFFIEGADIFRFGIGGTNRDVEANWSDPHFFYSRRIGRAPQGYTSSVNPGGYVQYPEWSTILAAGKITGKIGKDWNIGLISAFTEREYAQISQEGQRLQEEVEPFSFYGLLRVQKEFKQGHYGLGLIATSVLRNLRTENLENTLTRDAYSIGVDGWSFLDKEKEWVVSGWLGGSRVSGSQTAIWNHQHAYPHYFQRPDASHVELDENATSMSGWAGRLILNKQKGNFLFNAAVGAVSPGFDSSDMGFLWTGDLINAHILLGYQNFKPGKTVRHWDAYLLTQRNYDFGGNKIGEQRLVFNSHVQFLNYWGVALQMSYNPGNYSSELTRGGPLIYVPSYTFGLFSAHSDSRKPLSFTLRIFYSEGKSGSDSSFTSLGLLWKPASNFSIFVEPVYYFNHEVAQWVTGVEDGSMADTFGNRYIFGNLVQNNLYCSIRMDWTFTPRLSLQAYLQPYISVGAYSDFKELARPKSFDFNFYGEQGSSILYNQGFYMVDPDGAGPGQGFSFYNPDFNFKSLRGTVVLRWEYRPGSTFYFVWTQNRADFSNPGDFRLGRDFGDLLSAKGDNIFMIKFTHLFKF